MNWVAQIPNLVFLLGVKTFHPTSWDDPNKLSTMNAGSVRCVVDGVGGIQFLYSKGFQLCYR